MIDLALIREIASKSINILNVSSRLHLTNIAKAIEQSRRCQIFIMPLQGEDDRVAECEGFTATVEPTLMFSNQAHEANGFDYLHHFIFYRPDMNPKIEQYRIAHELGHCVLHWPLEEREDRKVSDRLTGIGNFYFIQYKKIEEEQADAFACIVCAHQQIPKKPVSFQADKNVEKLLQYYAKKNILQSLRYADWDE